MFIRRALFPASPLQIVVNDVPPLGVPPREEVLEGGTPQICEPGITKQLLKLAGFNAVRFTRFEVLIQN